MFNTGKFTVTVSPGLTAPSGGEQLSLTIDAAPEVTTGPAKHMLTGELAPFETTTTCGVAETPFLVAVTV
jgi:hypothetical protein